MFEDITISEVSILNDKGKIEKVDLSGTEDIDNLLDHDDAEHFKENRDGRIIEVGGEMKYKNDWYKINVGYTKGGPTGSNGKIVIEKRGSGFDSVSEKDEVYEFVYDIYEDYFITY